MSEHPAPNPAFYAKASAVLASIVSIGFLAWAGLVWTRSDDLIQHQNTIIASQQRIELKLEYMTKTMQEHRSRPWHDEAGAAHAQTRRELDAMRSRIDYYHDNGNGQQ